MLAANQKDLPQPVTSLSEGDTRRRTRWRAWSRSSSARATTRAEPCDQVASPLPAPVAAQARAAAAAGDPDAARAQTASELRSPNAAGIGGPATPELFAAASKICPRRAQPLLVLLSRAAGQEEARYAATRCAARPAADATPEPSAPDAGARAVGAGRAGERVLALEARVPSWNKNRPPA